MVATFCWAGSISSEKIEKMISEIKEERIGIRLEKLDTTVNPFILIEAKKEEILIEESDVEVQKVIVETVYQLEAVLNQAAFINKKWYKKGSSIDFYKLVHIGKDSVTLESSDGKKILPLKKKAYMKLH